MLDEARPEFPVEVTRMQQLTEAQSNDDDWTGLKDRAERRKRQNRLNVRAHRKRKQLQRVDSTSESRVEIRSVKNYEAISKMNPIINGPELPGTQACLSLQLPVSFQSSIGAIFTGPLHSISSFDPLSPNGTIKLPLSRDHLIPLVQYNVLRAILTNMSILALTNRIPGKRRPSACPRPGPFFPAPAVPPPSLAPTPLQLSTPHALWIDLLPEGAMRDNAIRYVNMFDSDSLCEDMVGGHSEGRNDIELNGILVWNNPWSASGWEVTEGFARKWGFLLKGCWEMMAATNRWREMRGDDPLLFELQE